MSESKIVPSMMRPDGTRMSATEFRALPRELKDVIMRAAAESAREHYLNDPELTAGEVQWGGVERDGHAQAG
jgi:hypothetical protein